MLRLTGGQALVRAWRAEAVGECFGIVGGKMAPLLQAIAEAPALRFHGVRHEAAAPMMASAVWRATGRMAVALAEMGPGALNLAAGLGVAANNRLPLLALTTNQHRAASYPHSGMFMDLDTLAVMRPLVKWNASVQDGRRIPQLVRSAFRHALAGAPGPVHLDVPHDVLSAAWDFADDAFDAAPASYRSMGAGGPRTADLVAALERLRAARRPLVVAGGGVLASGAEAALQALAQRLHAPVLTTQMGLDVVASDSPWCIGQGGLLAGPAALQACHEADLVIAFGCRFSSWCWDEHGPLVRAHTPLVNVNVDAAALGEPAPHVLGLLADAGETLAALLAGLDGHRAVDTAWLATLQARRAEHRAALDTLADTATEPVHPAALARAISQALPDDALVVYDGGHTSFWSHDYTPVRAPRTRFHEPGMSQLGFGLPYAIALQLACPGRPVVNITGDGSFGFTLQELDTARRLGTPVVTIVHHNAAWGIIRAGQRRSGFELGTALEGTDHAAIARGFGCHGETVTRPEHIAGAVQRALQSGLPAVIDAITTFEPHPASGAFASMNRYGFDALPGASPEA